MTTMNPTRNDVVEETSSDIVRQILIVFMTVSTIVVNGLANALPINGLTTGDISDRFNVLFVPSGYVFSIWGLIYIGLVGYSLYQALPAQRTNPTLRAIGPVYIVSALANIGWIFLWHYEQFVLTVPVMLLLLGSLITIYQRLVRFKSQSRWETLVVYLPFSIYLGWITVATVANITSVLDYLNWNGWGISSVIWFSLLLLVATGIGAAFAWLRRDTAYVAVLVWAFVGIAIKHSDMQVVVGASIVAALALVVVLGVAWWQGKNQTPQLSYS